MGRLCQAPRIQEKSCGKKPHIFYILIQARLEIILDRACTLGDVLQIGSIFVYILGDLY